MQRRAIEVILIEQADVPQEGELAVLEPGCIARACPLRRDSDSTGARLPVVGGAEEQLGVDDPLGEELGSPGRGGGI